MATREIKIEVPNGYEAITLRKYLELQDDLKAYGEEPEAQTAAMFYHLCGLTPELLGAIDVHTFNQIKDKLFSFVGKNDYQLVKFITISGVEYGFEPNLSEMAYGAYVDISKYESLTIDENWHKIMAILYRPVTKKVGKLYSIKPYTGDEPTEHWLDTTMDIHFGCLFFFINLSPLLLSATLNCLVEKEDIPHNIKQTLLKSGEAIQQYTNLLEEIS